LRHHQRHRPEPVTINFYLLPCLRFAQTPRRRWLSQPIHRVCQEHQNDRPYCQDQRWCPTRHCQEGEFKIDFSVLNFFKTGVCRCRHHQQVCRLRLGQGNCSKEHPRQPYRLRPIQAYATEAGPQPNRQGRARQDEPKEVERPKPAERTPKSTHRVDWSIKNRAGFMKSCIRPVCLPHETDKIKFWFLTLT